MTVNPNYFSYFVAFAVTGTVVAILLWWEHRVRTSIPKDRTFEAYKARHPGLVNGSKIRCAECNGAVVAVERMMGNTYRRRHYCKACGTTLYETKEN